MRTDHALLPMLMAALAVASLALMDAYMKSAALAVGALSAAWLRSLIATGIALPLWLARGGRWPQRAVLTLHLQRSVVATFMALTFFYAITKLPLAEAIAISFVAPLIALYLARLMLGEIIRREAIAASLLGFAGTLVVIRPGFGHFHWAYLLGLGAGVSYGLYQLTTRRLSGSGRPSVTLFYTAVFGLAVLSLVVPWVWRSPDPGGWGLMLVMGAVGALAHFLIIRAFEHAPAPMLAPVSYMEMVSAVTIGCLVFGDFPDAWTWLGIALIVTSGLLLILRSGSGKT